MSTTPPKPPIEETQPPALLTAYECTEALLGTAQFFTAGREAYRDSRYYRIYFSKTKGIATLWVVPDRELDPAGFPVSISCGQVSIPWLLQFCAVNNITAMNGKERVT